MASNSFGNIFKITTWGESHGKAIGVVIDGCPANLEIDESEINAALQLRSPGNNPYTSPRKEADSVEILSGIFEGKTTGTPISLLIRNCDSDSSKYEPVKNLLRPGHANYPYLEKYGIFDYRGGGRASARETACRVAAGAIAKKFLMKFSIKIVSYITQIADIRAENFSERIETLQKETLQSPLFCPDPEATEKMIAKIEQMKSEGDSCGGVVEFFIDSLPPGLGDPIYEKLEARLAYALMGLPASKGFEIGSGFAGSSMSGSQHNDSYIVVEDEIRTTTNYAGGIIAGISTGMPVIGRVAFKPASGIMKARQTITVEGEEAIFRLPEGSRHDPCVAIRAVPVVEAMVALVVADALLMNRSATL